MSNKGLFISKIIAITEKKNVFMCAIPSMWGLQFYNCFFAEYTKIRIYHRKDFHSQISNVYTFSFT